MSKDQALGIPAVYRKFLYHLTTRKCVSQIQNQGLVPYPGTNCRFGALSPEAKRDPYPKIFLLPVLNGTGMKSFIEEWWHGEKEDIVLLRIRFEHVTHPLQSTDRHYYTSEIWTHFPIGVEYLEVDKGLLYGPHKWVSLVT